MYAVFYSPSVISVSLPDFAHGIQERNSTKLRQTVGDKSL